MSRSQPPAVEDARRAPGGEPGGPESEGGGYRVLLLPATCGLLLVGLGLLLRGQEGLYSAFLGAGAVLLVWGAALFVAARQAGRPLTMTVAVRKHHWVQALAQITVLLYWGWYVRFVYAFLPLILAQIVFAYGVDSLLSWSRRGRYALGFGPFPVILSINLFLFVRPEWFHWQFAMIAVGYLGKDLVRWTREGRSAHIFNPSSLPLALFSLGLLVTGASDITLGQAIASSQYYPPNMYLLIFLAALPGQVLFGVARMTMPAVITGYLISVGYHELTGTYLFFDSHIPVPVFLGMHLLFTDPSTAPRSDAGRIAFGMLYGVGTAMFYVLLDGIGAPTFYDKLLPVPLLNLMVRRIDALAAGPAALRRGPADAPKAPASPLRRNLAYTSVWAVAFIALSALRGVGDDHPGQALPYWIEACRDEGNERACEYASAMTSFYCGDGSGWACNEVGLRRVAAGSSPAGAFEEACELGFPAGCENAARLAAREGPFVSAPPLAADLPIVLRGTKPPLEGWSMEALQERACEHGWAEVCRASQS